VNSVAVSLTHEQALVDCDPARVRPDVLAAILKDIGSTIRDPRKTRPFEGEEAALVKEGRRLYGAISASLAAVALIVNLADPAAYAIPVVVEGAALAVNATGVAAGAIT
jgi:hypothetical protein